MKKLLCIVLFITGLFIKLSAQDSKPLLVNKQGINILPEKGELSIGIDAVPFLNLFNDKTPGPGFNFARNLPIISVKYFTSDKTALRLEFLINHSTFKDGVTGSNLTNTDANSDFGVNAGYEKRIGKTRVQGFYGIQGGVAYGREKYTNFNGDVTIENSNFTIGLQGFLGVEYFIAPKLSIGGQYNWGPSYIVYNDLMNKTKTSNLSIGTDNQGGALILSFAF